MGRGIVSRGACLPCDPLRFSPRPADLCLAHISPPTPVHPPLLPPPHQPIDSPQYTDQSTDPPFISLRRAHFRVTARQHAAGRRREIEQGKTLVLSLQRDRQPASSSGQEAGGRRQKGSNDRLWCSRVSTESQPRPPQQQRPPTAKRAAGGDFEPAHHFRVILPPHP